MTFPSYLRSFLLTCLLLALTAGCSAIPETQSWFGHKHAAPQPAPSTATTQPPANTPLPPPVIVEAPPPHMPPATPALAPNAKIKAAILLPLSGPHAQLGQAMLNAAQLAVFDVADGHFELMPRDTAGNEAGSEAAIRDAINDGAQIIIGPVFASDVNRVKPVAVSASLNMLALTTDASLADQNVFVMGFAPGAQVERVVDYAHLHNLHKFAALIPKGPYGDLVSEALRSSTARMNDDVIAIESYDPARHDSNTAIQALGARRAQIDALLLPEAGTDLQLIAGQLVGAGFDRQRQHMLGTGLWDTPDIGQIEFLSGGWYAAPDPHARQNFLKSYVKSYGQEPPRIATLAYDATALVALLAKQGGHFDRTALTNPNGFAGIDGIFRLTGAGLVERGLAVLEVTPKGGQVIESAPSTFTGH